MSIDSHTFMHPVHSYANPFPNGARRASRLVWPISLVTAAGIVISAFLFCGISLLQKGRSVSPQESRKIINQPVTLVALAAGLALGAAAFACFFRKQRQTEELCNSLEKLSREASERRDQMRRFWRLVEDAPDPILTLSLDGIITSVNLAAEVAIGRSRDELLSKPFGDVAHFEDRNKLRELLQGAQCGQRSSRTELRILRNAGGPASIEFAVAPEMDNNRVVGLVAIGRNLSGRRKFEETEAVAQMRKQHAQDIERLRKFTGGVGHEFSNYLSAILTHCQMARLDLMHGHPAVQSLNHVNRITQHLANLVRQIPLFTLPQSCGRESVDLEPVVVRVLSVLRSKLPSSICIDARLDGHSPRVLANPDQIQQALLNLGANSAQAMVKKGGRLGITLETVQVNEAMAARNSDLRTGMYVRLSVADSGHGMDPQILDRIFDPFFTTKPVGEAAGLGLTMVRSILKQHEGAINVTSESDRGTVFDLYFPAESKPSGQKPAINGTAVKS